ncbi:MAG: type I methionyl aminopeptidase [Gammaproteobacteria bacterium]|nr:type I methionyl aminopeptidase [Pseudomonadota bacterium]MCH9662172.1 type I methionyl aminopeptidase [Gammaproteobacteria bacterium]
MTIHILSAVEIGKMRTAGTMAAQVLEMISAHVRPGVSTEDLDRLCHRFITVDLDAIPAPLNYHGFPKSVCTSINNQVCHGIPGPKRLREGDILNIDVTVKKDGYHGDTSKMFLVTRSGAVQPRYHARQHLIDVCRQCTWLGINIVKPGARLGDIGHVIANHAQTKGYSVVREYCGHGIGSQFHAEPQVLHYGEPGTGVELKEGMAFTIEPMINAGMPNVCLLKDNWTVVTADHSLSAQWEHTILVTANGFDVLTLRSDEQPL